MTEGWKAVIRNKFDLIRAPKGIVVILHLSMNQINEVVILPPPLRTYSWIARQPHNVRFEYGSKVEHDGHSESARYAKENKFQAGNTEMFERGVLWPSLILVEKAWDARLEEESTLKVYARIYRRRTKLIVDVALGHDMADAVTLATKFSVPLYAVSKSKRGKRGGAQRVQF